MRRKPLRPAIKNSLTKVIFKFESRPAKPDGSFFDAAMFVAARWRSWTTMRTNQPAAKGNFCSIDGHHRIATETGVRKIFHVTLGRQLLPRKART